MNDISKYRSSPINVINLRYGKETITINLARATKISESNLENEIKKQPSYYAFLSMLHKRLLTQFELAKLARKKEYGRLYAIAKDRKGSNGRYLSESAIKVWIESHKKYVSKSETCIHLRDNADQLFTAVRAFEMRANLMQTFSSNLRKERT